MEEFSSSLVLRDFWVFCSEKLCLLNNTFDSDKNKPTLSHPSLKETEELYGAHHYSKQDGYGND